MKLHQSKTLTNFGRFSWVEHNNNRYWKTRDCAGMFLYWKVCEYFQPDSILEIGFFEGLTFGLLFESTGQDCNYCCIDIDFTRKHHFDSLFYSHPKYNSIDFLSIDSKDVRLSKKFDLVHIDGDHSYDHVKNDIIKVLPLLHKNSILVIDDYNSEVLPGVKKAVEELLLGQHGFIPFLAGDKEMFFHHAHHDANKFLDEYISKNTTDIMTFFNADYHGFTVLKVHVPNFFNDNTHIFIDQLTKNNL